MIFKIFYKKITTLFLYILIFGVSVSGYSRDNTPFFDPLLQDRLLSEVLTEIGEKYQVFFNYDYSLIKGLKVDFNLNKEETLESALGRLLDDTGLIYEPFGEKYIILYKDDKIGKKNYKKLRRKINQIQKLESKRNIHLQRRSSSKLNTLLNINQTIASLIQEKTISGTITDSEGNPLPGATVQAKGTTIGAVADVDGKYEINVPDDATLLVFSFIGYSTQEVSIAGRTVIDIVMATDSEILDEVVVVGYTTEIKRNLTSSLVSINTNEINEIPATSLGNAIAGRLAGVSIAQSNGKPGSTSELTIRGATSGEFQGNNDPLYVIDNVIASKRLFDALDVSEVADITVLKDAASAAVYGARAANGVVLVKTHSGIRGKSIINFTSTLGTTEPTNVPPMTSAYQQAKIIEGVRDFRGVPQNDPERFSQAELDYLKANDYGSYAEQSAVNPLLGRVALNASGGTDKLTYFMSGSFIKQTGDFSALKYKKTNFRAKVAADITEDLNVSMNISTNNDVRDEFYWRWNGSDEDFGDFYRTANRTGAWGSGIHNGEYVANFNGWNPVHLADGGAGNRERTSRNVSTIIDLNYSVPFAEGLTLGATYNKLSHRRDQTLLRKIVEDVTFGVDPNNRFILTDEILGVRVRSDDGANSNSLQESTWEEESYQFNARIGYERTFGDHSIKLFGIYEAWERFDRNFWALRRGLQTELVTQLFATDPAVESQFSNGSGAEFGRASYIGGAGYNFQNELFLNASFRYDGSTKFAEDERWGLFPSVSAAWIMSERAFFKENVNFIDFFKLRVSYGLTGNDNVGNSNFPYIQSYSVSGSGAVFGESEAISNSASIGPQPDVFITWEKQASFNLGLDFELLNSKLFTSIDIFKNKKTDLYGSRQLFIPASSGLTLGNTNYGGIDISGIEIITSYRNKLGPIDYDVGFNFGYAKDKYTTLDEPETRRDYQLLNGKGTSRVLGYTVLGIIRTEEQLNDLIESGYTFRNAEPQIGAFYYKDLRGNPQVDPEGNTPDGNIDGNDQEYIGSSAIPLINYGIRLGLSFKRFHFQAFAQGFAGHQKYQPANNKFQFASVGQSSHTQWLDAWTPDNINGSLPRFGSPGSSLNSTFWLQDADYLRLKNVNISYDFSESLISRFGIQRLNLFANGTNLMMLFSKITEFDPETSGRGIPVNRSFSLGLNITF